MKKNERIRMKNDDKDPENRRLRRQYKRIVNVAYDSEKY